MSEQTLWTHEDVAKFLGVHPGHIRRLTSRRLIPHIKIKRLVRYDPRRIQSWVDRNTIEERRPTALRRRG